MSITTSFSMRNVMAKLFTFIFLTMTIAILYSLVTAIFKGVASGDDVMQMFLKAVNTGIIALAVFELALVINAEYSAKEDSADPVESIRRTIPRFIGTVCIALSLEGLIMVIKYSQLELAGNLYYPVAIISSTAFLLIALGVFLFLTQPQQPPKVEN
ncbi:hypothetical protein A3742_08890 [Oleiphilus sp. HI0071]|uniref:hypothetical protein n=1 Tax=unclassified Oleiphilus TaxID=2631174 RepID=UPI0007C28086|nr:MULTISPECIES: hypothetical protein [unclassified Oleiphilus]KZY68917.1 hypothetical protein A3737_12575 [Oleiphilus sp. HI0065]KZY82636.1 hypothetical protein A3742_08890 [Oleiphilus sp. HI0071]KZY92631.1 hypothetical protein A3744_02745 [Oleiphilus sp. HI0073]KZZ44544.1 hypothetical protein A3758_14740 [Oleiphilus sp. HI0118]KZZ52995.1 hypothetical protein A3760_09795 [Oleiphilus sp. HI0122]KZZ64076.1 hypothetical protein A3765_07345 [Oleiphilus sp. HI0130]KZZ75713.1 hypothetical protein